MKILEKIRWNQSVDGKSVKDVFGSGKYNKILNDLEDFSRLGLEGGILPMSIELLKEFNDELYLDLISDKKNAKVTDLIENYSHEIGKDVLFFSYIRHGGVLIGGSIFVKRGDMLIMAYKASKRLEKELGLRSGLGRILDFYGFSFGFDDLGIKVLSMGKDRNGYGLLGALPSLAKYKLESNFMPYDFEGNGMVDIDISSSDMILIFDNPGIDGIFKDVLIYNYDGVFDLGLFKKRGFNLIMK